MVDASPAAIDLPLGKSLGRAFAERKQSKGFRLAVLPTFRCFSAGTACQPPAFSALSLANEAMHRLFKYLTDHLSAWGPFY